MITSLQATFSDTSLYLLVDTDANDRGMAEALTHRSELELEVLEVFLRKAKRDVRRALEMKRDGVAP